MTLAKFRKGRRTRIKSTQQVLKAINACRRVHTFVIQCQKYNMRQIDIKHVTIAAVIFRHVLTQFFVFGVSSHEGQIFFDFFFFKMKKWFLKSRLKKTIALPKCVNCIYVQYSKGISTYLPIIKSWHYYMHMYVYDFFFIAKDRLSGISFICILLDYTYATFIVRTHRTHSHILLTLHFFFLSQKVAMKIYAWKQAIIVHVSF